MSGQFCNLSTYQIVMCSKYAYCLNVWMWGSYWDYVLASDQSKMISDSDPSIPDIRSFYAHYLNDVDCEEDHIQIMFCHQTSLKTISDPSISDIRSFYAYCLNDIDCEEDHIEIMFRHQTSLEWLAAVDSVIRDVPRGSSLLPSISTWLQHSSFWPSIFGPQVFCPKGVRTPRQHLHLTPTY